MQNEPITLSPEQTAFGLSRMARSTLEPMHLASFDGIDVYQVGEGWQREVLLAEADIHVVDSLPALYAAMGDARVVTVFVPKDRQFSQSDAEELFSLSRNKIKIFWEV